MRAWIKLAAVLIGTAVLAGCAHPILIATEKSAPATPPAQKIDKNVGFVIPDALLTREVVTPGGGGDKVSYLPYRDLELPLYTTLSSVFANATKLRTANDTAAIQKGQVGYIITPEITTDSSSTSSFTWPPTQFTVNLTCTVTDLNGTVVLKKTVTGEGNAEFAEFRHNFALSAQRASENMLKKLQAALASAPELRPGAAPAASTPAPAMTMAPAVQPASVRSQAAPAVPAAVAPVAPVAPVAARPVAPAPMAAATRSTGAVSMDDLRQLMPVR
ncbi:hypothetical protein SAMN05216345_10198 [Cupriavidus sp. YR651]|uniref:hypothetical protein n=1 Tax=Cupriavidus sp. YR651 TaxID=1855315 RepID=UPI00088B0943|nr:hypothetical protein [Cupriavidus sp. YR651]SDB99691.1 hypothetical protein SAMN05216345_10198 [Cupriavidus sp. YR651]